MYVSKGSGEIFTVALSPLLQVSVNFSSHLSSKFQDSISSKGRKKVCIWSMYLGPTDPKTFYS